MKIIEVPGGAVSVTIMGAGRSIVLLHSLLADRGSFDRIIENLSCGFRVIIVDLPGFGKSSAIKGTLPDFADRISETLRQLAADDDKPIVLGNGFGGFVALQMAIRHPDLASRLILADSGAAFSEEGRLAFRNMADAAASKGLEAVADAAMRRLFPPDFQLAHADLMAERRAAFLRTDPLIFQTACRALATLDLRDAASDVTIPVLLLAGEEDEATPPQMSEELASLLPDARFQILTGCAHVPPLQMPEAFLSAINEFIRQK